MSRWLCGQCVHAPSCEQRPGGRDLSWRCMMCTLPSEGVSFCLSAAAKSLLNKKADVKVRQPVSLALTFGPFSFSLLLSVSVLGCMSTTLKCFCVLHYFHHSKNTLAKGFDEIIADLVNGFSLLFHFCSALEWQWRSPPLTFLSFFMAWHFSSVSLSVRIISLHFLVQKNAVKLFYFCIFCFLLRSLYGYQHHAGLSNRN